MRIGKKGSLKLQAHTFLQFKRHAHTPLRRTEKQVYACVFYFQSESTIKNAENQIRLNSASFFFLFLLCSCKATVDVSHVYIFIYIIVIQNKHTHTRACLHINKFTLLMHTYTSIVFLFLWRKEIDKEKKKKKKEKVGFCGCFLISSPITVGHTVEK